MMTVHKAKGLEFPVVILADLTCKLSRAEAGRWIDRAHNLCALKIGGWAPVDLLLHDAEEAARDRAESERLTYVAATRARDLLVVPTIGDGPYEGGWLDPVDVRDLSARGTAPHSAARGGVSAVPLEGLCVQSPRHGSRPPTTVAPGVLQLLERQPRSPSGQPHPYFSHVQSRGGIRRSCI